MKAQKARHVLAVAWALWSGCNSGDHAAPSFPQAETVVPLEGAVLYLRDEPEGSYVNVVDLSGDAPRVTEFALPGGRASSQTRPGSGGKQALILTEGDGATVVDGKVRDAAPSCLILYERNGEVFRKELGARYTSLWISEDGSLAIASGERADVGVANAVAIVDLVNADAPVQYVNLTDSAGQPAQSFEFYADSGRRLLFVRGHNSLRLLDLDHVGRPAKEIPLTTADDLRTLRPGKAVFEKDTIFVQLLDSSDVLVLQLVAGDKDSFTVAPLTLATNSPVRDIELIHVGQESHVVAVSEGSFSVIDPTTASAVTTVTSGRYSDLILFEGRSPHDDVVRERGLLIEPNGSRIAFVDFDETAAWAQQSVEVLTLPAPVSSSQTILQHGLVLLTHNDSELALVDLHRRVVTPVRTGTSDSMTLLDTDAARANLWVSGYGGVARIDLLRLETTTLLLNGGISKLLMVEGTPRNLVLVHPSYAGYLTLIDAEKPSRETAREFISFFFTDFLD